MEDRILKTTNWEATLFEYLNAQANAPFQWGVNDCVTFCASAVAIMTGEDPVADLRGNWDSEYSAAKQIKSLGFDSLSEAVSAYLDEKPVALAMRGDIILCDDGAGNDFLAVLTDHMAVAPAPTGMLHIPRQQFKKAFEIGTGSNRISG